MGLALFWVLLLSRPVGQQVSAPLGSFQGFDSKTWRNASLDPVQQWGDVQDLASDDLDLDGVAEVVAVGTYSGAIGDIRVFSLTAHGLELRAAVGWTTPSLWEFHAVTVLDIDGDGLKEIVVGGVIHGGQDQGAGGIQIFRFSNDTILFMNGTTWGVGEGQTVVWDVGRVERLSDGREAIYSFSVESGPTAGYGAFIRNWVWNPGSQRLELLGSRSLPTGARLVIPLPCRSSTLPTAGYVVGGPEFVGVLSADLGASQIEMIQTPGQSWMAADCVDTSANGTTVALAGFPTNLDRPGVNVAVASVARSRAGNNTTFSLTLPPSQRWVGPAPVPSAVGKPLLFITANGLELLVSDTGFSDSNTSSRAWFFSLDSNGQGLHLKGPLEGGTGVALQASLWIPEPGSDSGVVILGGFLGKDPFVAWRRL